MGRNKDEHRDIHIKIQFPGMLYQHSWSPSTAQEATRNRVGPITFHRRHSFAFLVAPWRQRDRSLAVEVRVVFLWYKHTYHPCMSPHSFSSRSTRNRSTRSRFSPLDKHRNFRSRFVLLKWDAELKKPKEKSRAVDSVCSRRVKHIGRTQNAT